MHMHRQYSNPTVSCLLLASIPGRRERRTIEGAGVEASLLYTTAQP